jgi:hypothetical protein
VSTGYLQAIGASLAAGAWCPPLRFDFSAPVQVLVNRAFTQRYGSDVIGRHITFEQFGTQQQIVGVLNNIAEDGAGAPAAPYVYSCQSAGSWPDPEYVVRTRGEPRAVMANVREVIRRLDPNRAIFGVKLVNDVVAVSLDRPRLNASMLGMFAAAAIALASLGLYSLLTLIVSERSREMGMRMALGAAPGHVVKLVFAGTGRLLIGGVAIGLVLMAAAARIIRTTLFGVGPLDGATLALTVVALGVVTVMVSIVPAKRAASIDPIASIRAE